jgi:hypothetical protein
MHYVGEQQDADGQQREPVHRYEETLARDMPQALGHEPSRERQKAPVRRKASHFTHEFVAGFAFLHGDARPCLD